MINVKQTQKWSRKRFVLFGCLCLSPFALFTLLMCWSIWNSAGRYENRFAVLSTMLNLQLTGQQISPVGGRSDILLAKVGEGQNALDRHLNSLGWSNVIWMGAEGQSQKGNQKMRVVNSAMTGFFRIFGLGHSPYVVRG